MKMTPAEHADCRKEFRQYGYNPYDSESLEEWWHITEMKNKGFVPLPIRHPWAFPNAL